MGKFFNKLGSFFNKNDIFNTLLWLWNIAYNPPTKTRIDPPPAPIDYAKRCAEEDLLLADKASYVWGYVGKLTKEQARIVNNSLNENVDKGLWLEYMSSVERSNNNNEIQFVHHPQGVIRVVPRKPEAREFLAKVSPNLVFFAMSHLSRQSEFILNLQKRNEKSLQNWHQVQRKTALALPFVTTQKKQSPQNGTDRLSNCCL